jgi:hypothetical protein
MVKYEECHLLILKKKLQHNEHYNNIRITLQKEKSLPIKQSPVKSYLSTFPSIFVEVIYVFRQLSI